MLHPPVRRLLLRLPDLPVVHQNGRPAVPHVRASGAGGGRRVLRRREHRERRQGSSQGVCVKSVCVSTVDSLCVHLGACEALGCTKAAERCHEQQGRGWLYPIGWEMRWGSVVFACLPVGRVGDDGPVMLLRDGSFHGSRPSAPTQLAMQLERSKQQLPAPPQVWSIVAGGKQGSLTLSPKALSLKDVRCVRAPPLLCCMHGGLQLPAQPRTPLHTHSPALCAWRPGAPSSLPTTAASAPSFQTGAYGNPCF